MDVLIGVAWPYASGPRHLGHLAGAYLPADVAARYHRLAGDRVLLVSGSDQHGTPITVAAERAGLSPAALADREHERIAATFARAGISFDLYTRTATPNHHAVTQELFLRLHNNGLVTGATQPAAFCEREGRSLPDRYVEGTCPRCGAPDARGDQCDSCGRTLDPEELGSPRCRRCGGPAGLRPLRQLFLRLDLLQPAVARYVESHEGRWRPFVGAEARGWLEAGLRPRAITRDLDWGVPVPLPGWDDRRLYVWFDAVIGYLSASVEWAERCGQPDAWRAWWLGPAARHRYFVGKDNIWFHTVWWPAILLGAGDGLRPPDEVVANHHLTLAGGKLSASRGHAPTIDEAIDRFGLDPLRHALCALNPETADVELAWDKLDELTASGLLGAVAGPPHRVATLLWRRFGGHPDPAALAAAGPERAEATTALEEVGSALDRGDLRRALHGVHAIGRSVNRRLAASEPWHLPDPAAHRELSRLLPLLDALGVAAWPFVPTTAGRIRALLGRTPDPASWSLPPTPPVVPCHPAPPLPPAQARRGSQ
ncbi:MAG TPA: methionine--tRNA ligase [Actinomycetota bacterium]|jgi:methionyl-tRNA synthetase|nr:methionine--tRNA ligase [Actinomycetota bacterium]